MMIYKTWGLIVLLKRKHVHDLIHKSLYEAKDDYFSQESQSDGALERRIEFNRVKTLKVNS